MRLRRMASVAVTGSNLSEAVSNAALRYVVGRCSALPRLLQEPSHEEVFARGRLRRAPAYHSNRRQRRREGAAARSFAPSAQGAQPPFDGPAFGDSAFDVINDLEQLKRLYELSGRPDDIVPVYHEVLEKTHNPAIRRYAYDSLAREKLKPADPAQAISTLRASLEEDLAHADRAPRKDGGQERQSARRSPSTGVAQVSGYGGRLPGPFIDCRYRCQSAWPSRADPDQDPRAASAR